MKHLLLTTIAAVLLVGCGEAQKQVPSVKKSNPEADRMLIDALEIGVRERINLETVKNAIASGANVNIKVESGIPALSLAAYLAEFQIVKMLIDNGADVNAKEEEYGTTALMSAIDRGKTEQRIAIVKILIEGGADVNSKSKTLKQTPLVHAAQYNQKVITQILIDNGADVRHKDKHGRTPLYYAEKRGHNEIVGVLSNY